MFFAVKHIYLTLYIVHTYRVASTYGVPMYLAPLRVRVCARWRSLSLLAVAVVPPARLLPADRRTCSSARARVRPPARVCACVRVCGRVCAWACVCACVRIRVCVGACGRACFRWLRHFIRL